jgi:hypothetical protein
MGWNGSVRQQGIITLLVVLGQSDMGGNLGNKSLEINHYISLLFIYFRWAAESYDQGLSSFIHK